MNSSRKIALDRFNEHCFRAARLLDQAAVIATNGGLADVHVMKARAAAAIAGIMFHHIVGQADAVDMNRLRDDLELVARKVDPLIAAIGDEARCNTPGADKGDFDDCFKNVVTNAIEGNGAFLLSQCAEECAAAINNPGDIAERRRELHSEVAR